MTANLHINPVTLEELSWVIDELSAAFGELDEAIIECSEDTHPECDHLYRHDKHCFVETEYHQLRWQQPRQTFQIRHTDRSPWRDVHPADLERYIILEGGPSIIDELLHAAHVLGVEDALGFMIAARTPAAA